MNNMTKILILSLCAAALSLSSCQKKPLPSTPPPAEQKVPVGFGAFSQAAMVKSGQDEPRALSSFGEAYKKFGVWGIARSTGLQDYILWQADNISPVTYDPTSGLYIPDESAYWLSGYTYNFLALAPYEDNAVSNITATTTPNDALSFTCDLSQKYSSSDYDFTLLGTSETSTVNADHSRGTQDLIFWNLLSRIKIKVTFSGTTGTVTGMRLTNIDTDARYTLSLDDEVDDDKPLSVDCDASDVKSLKTASFSDMADDGNIIHIVPQSISDFELYLDFEVIKDGQSVVTTDFKVNLAAAKASPDYGYNEAYNWNITITPTVITFSVSVTPWQDGEEFESPIK